MNTPPATTPPRAQPRELSHTLGTAALALAAALLLLLAGCGGGDSASTGAASDSAAANNAPPTATCGLAGFSDAILQQVNARRATGASCGTRGSFAAAGALQWNGVLTVAAAAHSQDMSAQNYFDHVGLDGRTPGDRITAAGYSWATYGENIAAGYATVQAVVDAWFGSDGHCANLMNGQFRDIGVACVPGTTGSRFGTYWTMELATAR